MRLVFLGTPAFAVPSLEALVAAKRQVELVVTGPDRPRGRGHNVQATPVAQAAKRLGLPVYKTAALASDEAFQTLKKQEPDALVLVAFGQIVPKRLLNLPPKGCINVHPSLLPKHRGASPIHAPLLNGETVTGVTIMYMDEGLDTGDIVDQARLKIEPDDNAGDLHDRLAELGAKMLVKSLGDIELGRASREPQDDAAASYAKKVEKVEIDWSEKAEAVVGAIRGLSPFPGAYTWYEGKRLKLHRARLLNERGDDRPGSVVRVDPDGIVVAARGGRLLLTEVQPEGKRPMPATDFARGRSVSPGSRFGGRS